MVRTKRTKARTTGGMMPTKQYPTTKQLARTKAGRRRIRMASAASRSRSEEGFNMEPRRPENTPSTANAIGQEGNDMDKNGHGLTTTAKLPKSSPKAILIYLQERMRELNNRELQRMKQELYQKVRELKQRDRELQQKDKELDPMAEMIEIKKKKQASLEEALKIKKQKLNSLK